ncbi:MAG: hypothetical protein H6R17_3883 [Proteobacteria bacterium]|nr:hypothetical protein [Pseudomonadota bacterium]
MFLDTDLSLSRESRSRVLAASPYSLLELEEILITEIYPICWSNLNAAAGKRLAFVPGALEAMILRRESSAQIVVRLVELGRLAVPRSREWQATKAAVASLRCTAADGQACGQA